MTDAAHQERIELRLAGKLNRPIRGHRGIQHRRHYAGPSRGSWDTPEFRADERKYFGAEQYLPGKRSEKAVQRSLPLSAPMPPKPAAKPQPARPAYAPAPHKGQAAKKGYAQHKQRKWDHEDCRHCKGKRERKNSITGKWEPCPACSES